MFSTEKGLYGIAETAARWGVSPFSIRRLIEAGDLKAVNVGARILISKRELLKVEQHGVGTSRKGRKA